MEEEKINWKARGLFLFCFALFIVNKSFLRPWVLSKDGIEILKVLVLSLPNFIEAVLGTMILAGLLLQLKRFSKSVMRNINDSRIYFIASLLAAIYVITQEIKLHNLGGRNTYDPYDLVASILGLIFIYGFLSKIGLIERTAKL